MAQASRERKPRRAVFLDRDGVLNEDIGYAHRAVDLYILPGVPTALKRMRDHGYLLIVVSNQSGVARGYFDEEAVKKFHQLLQARLQQDGVEPLDDILYCPHLPDGVAGPYQRACDCRKPAPGMVLTAAQRHHIDLAGSWLVGDKVSDIACASAAGVNGIQIVKHGEPTHPRAHALVSSLDEAAKLIVSHQD